MAGRNKNRVNYMIAYRAEDKSRNTTKGLISSPYMDKVRAFVLSQPEDIQAAYALGSRDIFTDMYLK
jgi:hypothetical protein